MNKVILMGRLTRDPEVRYTTGDNSMAIARYTLAVDRKYSKNNNENNADFIPCVTFGKSAEFTEKYLKKGTKIAVTGRIQTGSYTNKDGVKVYTTDVVVEDQEFAESKNGEQGGQKAKKTQKQTAPREEEDMDGFMNIPDGIDEELPFKSSVGTNGVVITHGTGVIDADYQFAENDGGMVMALTNNSDQLVKFKAGDRIMQGVFVIHGITENDQAAGDRVGGMGSTGK